MSTQFLTANKKIKLVYNLIIGILKQTKKPPVCISIPVTSNKVQ